MFYNIALEFQDVMRTKIYTIIPEIELLRLVDAYENKKETVFINGLKIFIKDPTLFKIFDTSKVESNNPNEIQRQIDIYLFTNSFNKIDEDDFKIFGMDVTSKYIKGEWGEKQSVKVEPVMPLEGPKNGKIFISHSSKDQSIVNKFCDLILHNGLNINVTNEVFNTSLVGSKPISGEDFRDKIKTELINAKLVLQFISQNYRDSHVCLNEMGAAWVLSENVIPLIIEKGTYDVGFIHSTDQQCQLSDETSILEFIETLKNKGIIKDYNLPRLSEKVKEFVAFVNIHQPVAQVTLKQENRSNVVAHSETVPSRIFKIRNRVGFYLLNGKIYHEFPDTITLQLMGYKDEEPDEILVSEFSKLTKGAKLESVYDAEIIAEFGAGRDWILLNNKKHFIPDLDTLNYLIKACHCQEPKVIGKEVLDQIEQRDDLISITTFNGINKN